MLHKRYQGEKGEAGIVNGERKSDGEEREQVPHSGP